MDTRAVLWLTALCVAIAAVVTALGAAGLIDGAAAGATGAVHGLGFGAVLAVVVAGIHLVRTLYSRTPESTASALATDSVEHANLRDASAQAFADVMIVLALLWIASLTWLHSMSAATALAAVGTFALLDLGARAVALRRRGL